MNEFLILLLTIAVIVLACANVEAHWHAQRRLRLLEMANRFRIREIAAMDKKLEQYIATDERVCELWPEETL